MFTTFNAVVFCEGLVFSPRCSSRSVHSDKFSDPDGSSCSVSRDMMPQSSFIDENAVDERGAERANRMPSSSDDGDSLREVMDEYSSPHDRSNRERMLVSVSENRSTNRMLARPSRGFGAGGAAETTQTSFNEAGGASRVRVQASDSEMRQFSSSVRNTNNDMGQAFTNNAAEDRDNLITETSFAVQADGGDRRLLHTSASSGAAHAPASGENGVTAAMQTGSFRSARRNTHASLTENGGDEELNQTCATSCVGANRSEQMEICGGEDTISDTEIGHEDGLSTAELPEMEESKMGVFLALPPLPKDIAKQTDPVPPLPLLSASSQWEAASSISARPGPCLSLPPRTSSGVGDNAVASGGDTAFGDSTVKNNSRLLPPVPENSRAADRFPLSETAQTFSSSSADAPDSGFAPSSSLATNPAEIRRSPSNGATTPAAASLNGFGFTLPSPPQTFLSGDSVSFAPSRTHSSSSTESMDSGVWSLSPTPSPVGSMLPLSATVSSQPVIPPIPASINRHLSETVTPDGSSVPISSTNRDAETRRFSLPLPSLLPGNVRQQHSDSNAPLLAADNHHVNNSNAPLLALPPVDSRNAPLLPTTTNNHLVNNDNNNASHLSRTTSRRRVDRSALCETDYARLGRSMRELEDGRFYYPELDSDGARILLQDSPLGTFLVRDSSDARFLFAVSMKTERGPTSVRIRYARGLFQMDCEAHMKKALPKFETVLELLDFHCTLCREEQQANQYRWLEGSHRNDLVVRLSAPRCHSPPSLTHLARLTVNRCLEDLHLPARSTDRLPVPDSVRQFLRAYPYKL